VWPAGRATYFFSAANFAERAIEMDKAMEQDFADVIVRPTHSGTWSIEIPSVESETSTFVSFASDPASALQLAMSVRPQSRIEVCVTEKENSGLDWWSSL
jgi:hypothetical protein